MSTIRDLLNQPKQPVAPKVVAGVKALAQANELPTNISRCWQNNGYHAHMAGPCFDTLGAALKYRDEYDKAYASLMDFKKTNPWSWQNCPEWVGFQNKWRA